MFFPIEAHDEKIAAFVIFAATQSSGFPSTERKLSTPENVTIVPECRIYRIPSIGLSQAGVDLRAVVLLIAEQSCVPISGIRYSEAGFAHITRWKTFRQRTSSALIRIYEASIGFGEETARACEDNETENEGLKGCHSPRPGADLLETIMYSLEMWQYSALTETVWMSGIFLHTYHVYNMPEWCIL